jgi:putative endonuclease
MIADDTPKVSGRAVVLVLGSSPDVKKCFASLAAIQNPKSKIDGVPHMLSLIQGILRRESEPLGRRGEKQALRALRRAGYTILARNARVDRYEVDLIAREGDTTAFIEVKTRRDEGEILPEENVGFEKRRHLRKAARIYMAHENNPSMYYRFDIVSVVIPESGKPSVTIHRDAFQDE